MMPNSLNVRRELTVVLLEQVVVQKRFLKYPLYIYIYMYSVLQAAIQNRGKASFWDSEYSRVD